MEKLLEKFSKEKLDIILNTIESEIEFKLNEHKHFIDRVINVEWSFDDIILFTKMYARELKILYQR